MSVNSFSLILKNYPMSTFHFVYSLLHTSLCFKFAQEQTEVLTFICMVERNLPFTVVDCFTEVCKVLFPESNIVWKFGSGQEKTTMTDKGFTPPVTFFKKRYFSKF